jgi:hypothetical protein
MIKVLVAFYVWVLGVPAALTLNLVSRVAGAWRWRGEGPALHARSEPSSI